MTMLSIVTPHIVLVVSFEQAPSLNSRSFMVGMPQTTSAWLVASLKVYFSQEVSFFLNALGMPSSMRSLMSFLPQRRLLSPTAALRIYSLTTPEQPFVFWSPQAR